MPTLTMIKITQTKQLTKGYSFVTNTLAVDAAKRILSIVQDWTNGRCSQADAIAEIYESLPHFPVPGGWAEQWEYVKSKGGGHVHLDCSSNTVFVGLTACKDTWGHTAIGNSYNQIDWDIPGGHAKSGKVGIFRIIDCHNHLVARDEFEVPVSCTDIDGDDLAIELAEDILCAAGIKNHICDSCYDHAYHVRFESWRD
jgi:hypothetical protein